MSNINITVTEQDPINVSIASPEVQNVDVTGQSISATVTDGDKGDIVVTGNGTVWTLDPNALATRVPYTGATSDVNLGEFGLLTGNLEFDTTPTNSPTGAGSMVWNDTEGTVDLVLKGASVNLPIGQKQVIRAVNGTGGNLTRVQYRAVKITGAQGQRLQVSLARADNDANSKDTIGIVGEDISNNQTGFIVSSGLIEEINTTGSLQGETWADGDTLYLSGTTYGVITNVKPSAPTHTVILGFVVYAHANHGKIYVKVDNGYELTELHDVNTLTAASGDYLRYNGTTWVDATISAADLPTGIDATKIGAGLVSNTEFGYLDGVTSAIQTQLNGKQATLTLTTTGTSGAATLVGATLNIPQYQAVLTNPVTGTGTTNYLPKFTGASTVGNSQIFDNGTSVSIGITTGTAKLDVYESGAFNQQLIIRNAGTYHTGFIASSSATPLSDSKAWGMFGGPNNYITGLTDAVSISLSADIPSFRINRNTNLNGGPSATLFNITAATGNITVGGTSDAGYKLDIQGSLRNTTSAYFATSSGNVGIGTTSPDIFLRGYQKILGITTSETNGKSVIEINGGSGGFGGIDFGVSAVRYGSITAGSGEMQLGTLADIPILLFTNSNEKLRITGSGNIGISQATFGTSATRTIAVSSGVAPTTSPADAFQLYSADITAGNAAPHFRTEGGAVVKLYQQTTGVGAATFVQGSTNAVYEDSTFDGYTLKQIVKALRNAGFLA